jgi:hypothetical protein
MALRRALHVSVARRLRAEIRGKPRRPRPVRHPIPSHFSLKKTSSCTLDHPKIIKRACTEINAGLLRAPLGVRLFGASFLRPV